MSTVDYVLTISDGTTTVTLTSSPFTITAYAMRADSREVSTAAETIELIVTDGSAANNLDEAVALNRLLRQAEASQTDRALPYVYLTMKRSVSADAYRSRIIRGRIEWGADMLSYPAWYRNTQGAVIFIERQNFWEGPETAVAISNGNGTDVTSGLAIVNCNDGTGSSPTKLNNYAAIAAASVVGDLPGATRLEVINTYATYNLYDLWIGHNWTDPANAVQVYEAENATGATPTVDASASNGNRVDVVLASGSEANLFTWALSSAALSAAKGQWVHALIKFALSGGEEYCRFRLKLQWNVTTFWQSGQVALDTNRSIAIRDLMQLRLPPMIQGLGSLDAMNLILTGQQDSGSNQTLRVDFLALVPADGWRYLTCNGYGVAQNSRIVDDGINEYLYRDNGAGAERVGILTGYGSPVMLQPGKLQRLYFWQHTSTGELAPIDESISVKLYYRPRRLTI